MVLEERSLGAHGIIGIPNIIFFINRYLDARSSDNYLFY